MNESSTNMVEPVAEIRPKGRLAVLLLAGGLLCSAAVLMTVSVYGEREAKPPAPASGINKQPVVVAAPKPLQSKPNEKIEGEIVTIRPVGFDPPEIIRAGGRFTLLVDNRSGLEGVTLRLDQEGGPRLHDVEVPREKLDWVQGVDLAPGQYLLTEANNPSWVCRITITP